MKSKAWIASLLAAARFKHVVAGQSLPLSL